MTTQTSTPRNPFTSRMTVSRWLEKMYFLLFGVATYFILVVAFLIFGTIAWEGGKEVFRSSFPFVNVPFLTESPESLHVITLAEGQKLSLGERDYRTYLDEHPGVEATFQGHESFVYAAGGIFPAIVGTVILTVGAMVIALTLGILSAIFLSEYSKPGRTINMIRLAILNLAGVPSIVFGMFGYSMFVVLFGWNVSILAGWFTLAFMVLPIIITSSEESLRAVPQGYREASLALGATKWQTIYQNVLPYALPGMLTSSILGIARVAGETAPIMFTAAFVMKGKLPWEEPLISSSAVSHFIHANLPGFLVVPLEHVFGFLFSGVMALPYHIYVVSAKLPPTEYTHRVQFGTAFVFLVIVAMIAMVSIVGRIYLRRKYRW